MRICTLLTDFGLADYYVGAVKGALLRLAPRSTLVDLTHEIPPGDLRRAGFVLAAALPSFPAATVHLAVVDPGVGSARRIVAGRFREHLLVAPDNGLLSPLLPEARLVEVIRPDLFERGPGETFHGRDRFAPVAAALLRGTEPEELGRPLRDPVHLPVPVPTRSATSLAGTIVHIDRFGNAITDIPTDWLGASRFIARVGTLELRARASHYAELESGEAAVLPGSTGTLELARRDAPLAPTGDLRVGAAVVLEIGEDDREAID